MEFAIWNAFEVKTGIPSVLSLLLFLSRSTLYLAFSKYQRGSNSTHAQFLVVFQSTTTRTGSAVLSFSLVVATCVWICNLLILSHSPYTYTISSKNWQIRQYQLIGRVAGQVNKAAKISKYIFIRPRTLCVLCCRWCHSISCQSVQILTSV